MRSTRTACTPRTTRTASLPRPGGAPPWTAAALASLRAALLAWYDAQRRPLPWRRRPTPYRVWVSEIMLQQTRVDTVIPYFERFVRSFPTVSALAAAPLDTVLKQWEGLGYYARARRLHAAAQHIVQQRGGRWPESAAEWRTLPGIGRYTAAALASITRGAPEAVVDGNVKRVLARLLNSAAPVDRPASVARLWRAAQALLDPARPGDFNQAVMELGATVCTPRRPRCPACPWQTRCAARAAGRPESLPRTTARTPAPRVQAVALAIRARGRWLLQRRPESGLLGGLWQLPGSDVQPGESPADAAGRIAAGLDRAVVLERELGVLKHEFTHRRMRVHLWLARRAASAAEQASPTRNPAAHDTAAYDTAARWFATEQLSRLALARLDQKLIHRALAE